MIRAKITENNFQLFWTNHLTNTTPAIVKIVIWFLVWAKYELSQSYLQITVLSITVIKS